MLKRYYNRVIIFGRGNSMRKTDKGFSLVELLIVVIIIGILAGILYLVVGPSDDMVREKACSGNRATIMLALDAYRFSNGVSKESYTLQNFIDDNYKDNISNKEVKCPSDGIYSAGTLNGREAVVCSVHGGGGTGGGDDPGGGDEPDPPGNIIPGTDKFGGDGYQALDNWEDSIWIETWPGGANAYISVEKGKKYYFDSADGSREYFISLVNDPNVMFNGSNKDEQGNIITTPDNLPSWTSQHGTGLVRFTGVSENWEDINNGDKFYRGDIIYFNGDYYVCMISIGTPYTIVKNVNESNSPNTDLGTWYKLSN